MSRSKARIYIVLILLTAVTSFVYAQPGPPPDPEVGDNPVPITGIEYLIAAGAAFGAKKLYNKKKAN